MGNNSSRVPHSGTGDPIEHISTPSSSTSSLVSTSSSAPDPDPISKPPTSLEVFRNFENLCDANPTLDQCINLYGPFLLQMDLRLNTLEEVCTEMNKVNRSSSTFLKSYHKGVKVVNMCGTIYIWSNHVVITALDRIRVIKRFDRSHT